MRLHLVVSFLLCAALAACGVEGAPPTAPVQVESTAAALGESRPTGQAWGMAWAAPKPALTPYIVPFAASASGPATIIAQPDCYRGLHYGIEPGWDGGSIIIKCEDYFRNEVSEVVSTPGEYYSAAPCARIVSITKTAVGSSSARLQLGPADRFGVPTKGRALMPVGMASAGGLPEGVQHVYNGTSTDPLIEFEHTPDGRRSYLFIGLLQ